MSIGKGKPGEPGEPGKPGTKRMGGAGGKGGTGGEGGHVHYSWVLYLTLIAFVVAAIMSTITFIALDQVNSNTDNIATLQRHDKQQLARENRVEDTAIVDSKLAIQAARGAEFRICLRQQITRAALNLDSGSDELHLPLYDCKPNLVGKPARRLSPKESAAMLHYVKVTKNLP